MHCAWISTIHACWISQLYRNRGGRIRRRRIQRRKKNDMIEKQDERLRRERKGRKPKGGASKDLG